MKKSELRQLIKEELLNEYKRQDVLKQPNLIVSKFKSESPIWDGIMSISANSLSAHKSGTTAYSTIVIYKQDIPKLIKALQKG